jgi:hypothetical protein
MDLSNFLKKFTALEKDRNEKKDAVLKCINLVSNLNLTTKDFSITNDKVSLKTPGTFKFEISLRKKEILDCISKELGIGKIKDLK